MVGGSCLLRKPSSYNHKNEKDPFLTTKFHVYTVTATDKETWKRSLKIKTNTCHCEGGHRPTAASRRDVKTWQGQVEQSHCCDGCFIWQNQGWCRLTALWAEGQSGLKRPHSQRALLHDESPLHYNHKNENPPSWQRIFMCTRLRPTAPVSANGHGYRAARRPNWASLQ